jgi:hypothetical protein
MGKSNKSKTKPKQSSETPASINAELDELLAQVVSGERDIDDLEEEDVVELRKRANPYAHVLKMSKNENKFFAYSITNLSEDYQKKLLTTSLIGFLYRQGDEFGVPQGDYVIPVEELDREQIMREFIESNIVDGKVKIRREVEPSVAGGDGNQEESTYNRFKRLIIREFLDGVLQHNPDKNIRSAYRRNKADPTRHKVTPGKKKKVPPSRELVDASEGDKAKAEYRRMTNVIPPVELFKHYENYFNANYDAIRMATNDLYAEKPDLDYMINIYDCFDSEEKYNDFVHKHEGEFTMEIRCARQNHWVVQTPTSANRETLQMYNREHRILQEILDTKQEEAKLGRDLMQHKMRKLKQKNVEEAGPDDEKFLSNYKKSKGKELRKSGMKEITDRERRQLEVEERYLNEYDRPSREAENTPDSIEVRMFEHDPHKRRLTTSTFLTRSDNLNPGQAGIAQG